MTENDYDPTKKESYPLWIRFETIKDSMKEAFPSALLMLFHNWFFSALTATSVMLLSILIIWLYPHPLYLPYVLVSVFGGLYTASTISMGFAIYYDKNSN